MEKYCLNKILVERGKKVVVLGILDVERFIIYKCRLKYCTSFSCFFAAAKDLKVPRFLRLPVFEFFFPEYKRYSPDFSLRIIRIFFSCGRLFYY